MRAFDDYNFPAFFEAAEALRQSGHSVFNPAENDCKDYGLDDTDPHKAGVWLRENQGEEFDIRRAIREDLDWICLHAEAVVMLPGWETSAGVMAEKATAESIGVPVFTLAEFATPPAHATQEHAVRRRAALDGEVREVSKTGGQKGSKMARFDLIPVEALELLAKHFGVGALKYEDNNWRRGYPWHLSYAALQRHLAAFWSGKDYDDHLPDCPADCVEHTGSLHIVCALWHACVLTTFVLEQPDFDDRWSTTGFVSKDA